jgi:hypothetical protein
MKTFIADIIPKIERFSQKLDDLTKLTNQHWVSLGEITEIKRVFIFRPINQLLISSNGIVDKGSWEYLGNQSLLIDTKQESYLLKHGFFDENVIALKLDSTDSYAFFVNETKYDKELNNIGDVLKFLENKYLKNNQAPSVFGSNATGTINEENGIIRYEVIHEWDDFDIVWGKHKSYKIQFQDGSTGVIYMGKNTGRYFFTTIVNGRTYCDNLEDAAHQLYQWKQKYK